MLFIYDKIHSYDKIYNNTTLMYKNNGWNVVTNSVF